LDPFTFVNKRNNTVKMDSFLEHRQLDTKNEISDLAFWFSSLQHYYWLFESWNRCIGGYHSLAFGIGLWRLWLS
jgi:hypothetical protein